VMPKPLFESSAAANAFTPTAASPLARDSNGPTQGPAVPAAAASGQ
jgi:hypothetical protein